MKWKKWTGIRATLTKEYGQTDKYVHEHHVYDKNNAEYVNVGSFTQKIWCHCKLRKGVDK